MRSAHAIVIAMLLCLCLSACSVLKIEYGGATVTSIRPIFDKQDIEGLTVKTPEGVEVGLNKKSNEAAGLEQLGALIGTAAGAMAKKAATP